MKYYLRLIIAPIVYFISTAFIGIGIQALPEVGIVIKLILNVLALGLYGFCSAVVMIKEGEASFSKLLLNDISRRKMVEGNQDIEIVTIDEYRPSNGFIAGAICVAPLIILVLINLIVSANRVTMAGVIAEMFYSPIYIFFGDYTNPTTSSLYWGFLANVVFLPLSLGIPYIFGARKRRKQDEMVKETDKKIHGDVK